MVQASLTVLIRAQDTEMVVDAMVVTTIQAMSQPVRSLCPPPDVALESIC